MECSGVLKDQLTCDSNLVQKIRSGGVCKVPYGEGCTAPGMGNDITVTALSLPLPFRHSGLHDGGAAVSTYLSDRGRYAIGVTTPYHSSSSSSSRLLQ